MDLEIVTKNINKMTNKEKITLIQTLLGVSGMMMEFLSEFQRKCVIPLPSHIHYTMIITMTNLHALSKENATPEIKDYSLIVDSDEGKLISILKQLNEIYKDKL